MRTYYEPAETTCKPCGPSCHHCEDATSCCLCESGFNLLGTNACFHECPAGYFNTGDHPDYDDTPFCEACHSSCDGRCHGDSDEDCVVCPINQLIWNDLLDREGVIAAHYDDEMITKGACIDAEDCPAGYGPLFGVCVECPDDCMECAEEKCLRCVAGTAELYDGSCGFDLWTAYPGCAVGDEDGCEACVEGFTYHEDEGTCTPICGPRQWFNPEADLYACVDGDPTCGEVAEDGSCLTCRPAVPAVFARGMQQDGTRCRPQGCSARCASCYWIDSDSDGTYSDEICTSCRPGFFLDPDEPKCERTECPDYLLWDPDEGTCSECPAEDGVCETCNRHGCTSCPIDTPLLTSDQ